jgi:hypothetical protein
MNVQEGPRPDYTDVNSAGRIKTAVITLPLALTNGIHARSATVFDFVG